MNAFSKKADELLQRSVELDNAAKPGDTYVDPVWGTVSVPTIQDQWIDQAWAAIRQGQSENDFVSHCHPDNRTTARKAYKAASKYCPKCGRPKSEPHCGFGESWQ